MKFVPHDYQKYAIEYIKQHPVSAILLDMGLGKTVITLTALHELLTDESTTSAVLLEEATKANANFNSVLFIAYKKMAKQERDEAYKAKRDADSVKAAVARSDDYKAATELFTKGDQMYSMQNAPKAYKNYKAAKEAYTTLYTEVSEKRAAAQTELRRIETELHNKLTDIIK